MSLRIWLILITTMVVTVLFGVSEWFSYQHTAALLDEHEAILMETADHAVALEKLKATRDRMFVSVTVARMLHAVVTLLLAVAILNYVWYRVIYRPIQRLLSHINSMGRGTWHSPVPVKRHDEIGELSTAFNDLGRELHSTFQHINAASRLSALALIGGRTVRSITSVRVQIAESIKALEQGKDGGRARCIATLVSVQTELAGMQDCFQHDFNQEFSRLSTNGGQRKKPALVL
jgi:HAMP domain-containing protein